MPGAAGGRWGVQAGVGIARVWALWAAAVICSGATLSGDSRSFHRHDFYPRHYCEYVCPSRLIQQRKVKVFFCWAKQMRSVPVVDSRFTSNLSVFFEFAGDPTSSSTTHIEFLPQIALIQDSAIPDQFEGAVLLGVRL